MVSPTKLPLNATGNETYMTACGVQTRQEQEIEGQGKSQH